MDCDVELQFIKTFSFFVVVQGNDEHCCLERSLHLQEKKLDISSISQGFHHSSLLVI